MDSFESDAIKNGFKAVAGVDEAGRGPLAGPVVASAVIFSILPLHLGINDSKKLTKKERDSLVLEIYRTAQSVGIGIVWPEEVDSINIHKATLLAMKKAVASLNLTPDLLLIDGTFPIDSEIQQRPIISGDALSISIAAASIVAKTTRDRIMEAYHLLYPQYDFINNKGYGTKDHLLRLSEAGPCPIHRMSFRGVLPEKRLF